MTPDAERVRRAADAIGETVPANREYVGRVLEASGYPDDLATKDARIDGLADLAKRLSVDLDRALDALAVLASAESGIGGDAAHAAARAVLDELRP